MKVIDPGHTYALNVLDGPSPLILTFVKRIGDKYPGNKNAYPGTQSQEVIRALIDRAKYVNEQEPHEANKQVISCLQQCLFELENRAAQRHGRILRAKSEGIELIPSCLKCGHIECSNDHL